MICELRYFNTLCVFSDHGSLTLCDLNGTKSLKKSIGVIGKSGEVSNV